MPTIPSGYPIATIVTEVQSLCALDVGTTWLHGPLTRVASGITATASYNLNTLGYPALQVYHKVDAASGTGALITLELCTSSGGAGFPYPGGGVNVQSAAAEASRVGIYYNPGADARLSVTVTNGIHSVWVRPCRVA